MPQHNINRDGFARIGLGARSLGSLQSWGTARAKELTIANAGVTPSLRPIDSAGLQMSVEQRRVSNGDVYFLFNECHETRSEQLRIEGAFNEVLMLDPETGKPG